MKRLITTIMLLVAVSASIFAELPSRDQVIDIIHKVNRHWQAENPQHGSAIWHNAAYHTGNMEAYFLTSDTAYRRYSESWAEQNEWMGAKGQDRSRWKYSYGETDDFVLFGDQQTCFQTYIDLYTLDRDPRKLARAYEVMSYQVDTEAVDYWWWVDGLYMVMPVMSKLYKLTGDERFAERLYDYWQYADFMYDSEAALYYRDAKYIYPKHSTPSGLKDFWARGDGWVFAGLAKVLGDLPADAPHRDAYLDRFCAMAASIAACQQPDGYWTRSLLDKDCAPGPETSGTAFLTYGLLWGLNNGVLPRAEYAPVVERAWNYLATTALQPDGRVGYVQPIGEQAIPGQIVDANSTANFGVGAFLLAACEMARYVAR